jgi:IS66 Orf2 like protein
VIQITPHMRVLVAIEPVDGRKGIDSLAQLCREKLAEDPFSGCVFVFRSRSGTAIRLLTYDGQGYWLLQKRLSVAGSGSAYQTTGILRGPTAAGGGRCIADTCRPDVETSQ